MSVIGRMEDELVVYRVINCLLGAGLVVVGYFLAKELLNSKAGLIAALLITFFPLFWFWSLLIMTESLFLVLQGLAFLFFIKFEKNRNKEYLLALAGIFTGLAFLTRLNSFLIFIIQVRI